MRLCIPVMEENGLQSEVCAYFGSAPVYMVIDTETGECVSIINERSQHKHGGSHPLEFLEGQNIDCLIVGGIGRGALYKLSASKVKVYFGRHNSVASTLEAFRQGCLEEVGPDNSCGQDDSQCH